MRIDLLHALSAVNASTPWPELLRETREKAVLADELGLDGFWVGEHHFDRYGTDRSPNPVMLAADLAGRTSQIRLGMAAVTLPLWHPLRLAEDLALLDQFCDGRLDVAFSRGILQPEIVNLNAEADRKNDAVSKAIFAENLEVIRAAWTMDPLRWKGERHEFPHPTTEWPESAADAYEREGGERTGLVVLPQPVQQPTPPLYSVTESRSGFVSAGEQGLGVITWYPTRKVLDGLNATYDETTERTGGRPSYMGRSAVVLRSCCIAPTDEEAYELVRESTRQMFQFIKEVRGIGVWLDEGEEPDDPALDAMDPFELLLERDHLMVGSPQSVTERMLRMGETHGIDHWLLSVHDEDAERTMRLLSEEVAPALRRGRPAAV